MDFGSLLEAPNPQKCDMYYIFGTFCIFMQSGFESPLGWHFGGARADLVGLNLPLGAPNVPEAPPSCLFEAFSMELL